VSNLRRLIVRFRSNWLALRRSKYITRSFHVFSLSKGGVSAWERWNLPRRTWPSFTDILHASHDGRNTGRPQQLATVLFTAGDSVTARRRMGHQKRPLVTKNLLSSAFKPTFWTIASSTNELSATSEPTKVNMNSHKELFNEVAKVFSSIFYGEELRRNKS
jgi:hypothetical protein